MFLTLASSWFCGEAISPSLEESYAAVLVVINGPGRRTLFRIDYRTVAWETHQLIGGGETAFRPSHTALGEVLTPSASWLAEATQAELLSSDKSARKPNRSVELRVQDVTPHTFIMT